MAQLSMQTWQRLKRNPSLWTQYFVRETVLSSIREYFHIRKFHEVETPIVIAHPPAESYLEVFETTLLDRNRKPTRAYLSTSPETSLKKLMVAGLGDCFAITKSFRNMETQSSMHNPEFTILEWYRIGADYRDIMQDCEELLLFIHRKVELAKGNTVQENILRYKGAAVSLAAPWERLRVADAFKKWADVDFDEFLDDDRARDIAAKKGYQVESGSTWEQLYNQIFLNEVEPKLGRGRPTILYDFPGVMGALARKKPGDPRYAERFEFYIEGLELGDCYSELTDWKEQDARFRHEMEEIRKSGRTVFLYDYDFIRALKEGLPACSGIAVGVDRLVMLFAGVDRVAETLFFPAAEMFSDADVTTDGSQR